MVCDDLHRCASLSQINDFWTIKLQQEETGATPSVENINEEMCESRWKGAGGGEAFGLSEWS